MPTYLPIFSLKRKIYMSNIWDIKFYPRYKSQSWTCQQWADVGSEVGDELAVLSYSSDIDLEQSHKTMTRHWKPYKVSKILPFLKTKIKLFQRAGSLFFFNIELMDIGLSINILKMSFLCEIRSNLRPKKHKT